MAGRYKAYPEYNDSEVKWLGDYPAHWKLWPCRSLVNNRMNKNEGAKDQNYLSLMANVGVIRYEDKGDVGNKKPDDLTKCKIVKVGDLVINSMNYAIGSYGMSPYSGVCSPVYIVLRCIDSVVHRRFALRLFENKPFQKHLATFGNGILEHRAAIGWDDIKGSYVPVPPQSEQLHILKFLDHETGKIDALIEKQQALIALLQEKRQAVISHAVTKGLNPEARMKDSGVEWLGEVPEGWEVKPLRYFADSVNTGGTPKEESSFSDEGEVEWFTPGDFADDLEIPRAKKHVTRVACHKGDAKVYRKGSVLLIGIGATLGRVSWCDREFSCNQQINVIEVSPTSDGKFLAFALSAQADQMKNMASAATLAIMNQEKTKALWLSGPDIVEQREIVAFLEDRETSFKALLAIAETQINLLQERRTALISAAVTGKIDVRDWEPAPEA